MQENGLVVRSSCIWTDIFQTGELRRPLLAGLAIAHLLSPGLNQPAYAGSSPGDAVGCQGRNLRIAIDAGHTRKAPGTLTAHGAREFDLNVRFAHELVELSSGIVGLDLFLIDPTGNGLSLRDRPKLAQTAGANAFVSIHHDSAQPHLLRSWTYNGKMYRYSTELSGYSLFVSQENLFYAASRRLAEEIARQWLALGRQPTLHHAAPIKGENRRLLDDRLGVYEAPFAVIRTSHMPAVLVEVGVVVNPAEELMLDRLEERRNLQTAMINAFVKFCQSYLNSVRLINE